MSIGLSIDEPAYFDRLAQVEAEHWWSRGMWRLASHWLDAAIGETHLARALDVGCGAGGTAIRLADRYRIGEIIGLDPSEAALDRARRRHDGPLILGSALELPFEDASFDLVACLDVMQHLPEDDDARAASELHRVLRPGGLALVRSNALSRRAYRGEGVRALGLRHLVGVLSDAGLKIRRASRANCLPAMAEEVRGRLGSRPRQVNASKPEGGGLCIRVPSPAVNRIMGAVSTAEAWVAGRAGVPLPYGHSTMVLATREGG
ncbi:class I SAM-dependent methyltransferase [Isosphaeraceae bacterium EP7]